MFDNVRRLFGAISITTKNNEITVHGVPADVMTRDIKRLWSSDRVNQYMFSHLDKNSFTFPSFFAPDVVYMLGQLTEVRRLGVSRKTLIKIREQLLEETWLAKTLVTPPSKLALDRLSDLTFDPLGFQAEFFRQYDDLTQKYGLNGFLFAGAAGSGKAQPLDAKIKVPNGWSTMGEMRVGTEVIAKDGTTTKVIAVYPQGVKDIYKITFADGRSTECCAEHLWKITRPKGPKQRYEEVVNTLQLKTYLEDFGFGQRIHIDLIDPEEGQDADLEIHPYLLGVYLGDGGSTGCSITVSTPDDFIYKKIISIVPEDCAISVDKYPGKCASYRIINNPRLKKYGAHSLRTSLEKNGLLGLMSHDKYIPKEYLGASRQQRLELLQGLMDTDGTIDIQGTSSYSTTSKQLALDVQYLIRSLGGVAKIASRIPTFTYLGEKKNGRTAYQVNIRHKKPSELFTLPKKFERTNDEGQYNFRLKLRVESIELVGRKEAQCISIDHPEHLYVTDDFIVTHNTYSSLALTNCLDADVVIVICPKAALNTVWEASIIELFKDKKEYWISSNDKPFRGTERFVVGHYESLERVAEIAARFKGRRVAVILDESHNLNTPKSLRTARFIEMCQDVKSENIIWLSGTPIKALSSESIPLLRCIDPLFTPDVEYRFKKIFKDNNDKAVAILNNRIGIISFKVEKKELKLQPPIMKEIKVKIPNGHEYTLSAIKEKMRIFIAERHKYYSARKSADEQFYAQCLSTYEKTIKDKTDSLAYEQYRSFVKLIIRMGAREVPDEMAYCNRFENTKIMPSLSQETRKAFKDVKSIIKYVHLKIQGECLGRIVGGNRMQVHVDMVPHIPYRDICETTEKKTVVFSAFVPVVEATTKLLTSQELNPVAVYGKTNANLASIIKVFEQDEGVNPLVATYASLSTAVPLVMADTMILVDSPFRDYILQQAISRIHRLGSTTQTYVYTVTLDTGDETNISTRSTDILKWSQQQVESIMGITSPFVFTDDMEEFTVAIESYLNGPPEVELSLETIAPAQKLPAYMGW